MIPVWISLAGGFGALTRFVADGMLRAVFGRDFPWSTLIINAGGSFILGLLTGLTANHHVPVNDRFIFGTGFCGGFTTFSTASFETVRLLEEKRHLAALLQAFGNLILALAAAAVGLALAT